MTFHCIEQKMLFFADVVTMSYSLSSIFLFVSQYVNSFSRDKQG